MRKLSNKMIFSALLLFLLMPLFVQGIEFESPIHATSVQALVKGIANWVYWIALALAPLMIIIGAFYLITASGDPERVNTGKKIITWTIIGIAIVLLSTGIMSIIEEILSVKK